MGRENCCLWLGGKDVKDILLGCSETGIWRREILYEKWPSMIEDVADKKILMYRVRTNYRRILQNHIFTNTEQKYIMLLPFERGMFAVS